MSSLALPTLETRQRIVAAARDWIGTPFHHQARLKGVGADCAGLVTCVFAETGIRTTDDARRDYSRYPLVGNKLFTTVASVMRQIELAEAKEGSVLMFWIRRPGLPQHLAIKTSPTTFIHAWSEARQVIELELSPYWQQRLYAAFDPVEED